MVAESVQISVQQCWDRCREFVVCERARQTRAGPGLNPYFAAASPAPLFGVKHRGAGGGEIPAEVAP